MAPSSINTSVYSNPSLQKILTSPRYASDQDGQNHNDSALLKWANGLTQPKDKGGLHVSDKNGNYDAFNHGDKATRAQISQYANVLVTGTSTQRALARAQLSSLIPKQLAALQKDTSGLPNANANSNSRAGQELPPGPTFTNGLDVLSKLGALKGKPGYDGFNPSEPTKGPAAPELGAGSDPTSLESVVPGNKDNQTGFDVAVTTQGELSASKNPQLAALGAQLKTAINSWATAKGNGAGKDDVLLQAATAQINGITGQVKSYKGVLDAVGSLEAESKKTPPDPTALKGYAVALSKVDLKGLPANDPVRAQVIGDLAGYNKLANTNLKPTDTSAVPAAHPAGQPSTWTVGKTGQQTSIWDIAQHVLTKSRPAGSPAPSDQDVFEYAQHIINNKNNPALLRGNGDVSGNVILNGQKLDLPAPPPPPVADPGTSTNQDPTRPSSTVTA